MAYHGELGRGAALHDVAAAPIHSTTFVDVKGNRFAYRRFSATAEQLAASMHARQVTASSDGHMTLSSADFKHGDAEFGIFYPTGYVLSVFPEAAQADSAVAALRDAGFRTDELVVASGPEVLEYSRELRADRGLYSRFRHFVSSLYGDEAPLADELVQLAERGHRFVAIYAPDSATTTRVFEAVRPFAPVVLRKFDSLSYTDFR